MVPWVNYTDLVYLLQRCLDSEFSRKLDLWSFLGAEGNDFERRCLWFSSLLSQMLQGVGSWSTRSCWRRYRKRCSLFVCLCFVTVANFGTCFAGVCSIYLCFVTNQSLSALTYLLLFYLPAVKTPKDDADQVFLEQAVCTTLTNVCVLFSLSPSFPVSAAIQLTGFDSVIKQIDTSVGIAKCLDVISRLDFLHDDQVSWPGQNQHLFKKWSALPCMYIHNVA